MSAVYPSQKAMTNAVDNLYYETGYAQQEVQILMNAGNEDLSDPATLAKIEQAYQFFEALKNSQPYYTPDGKLMDFSVFGANGIFGDKSAQFETLVDNVLKSFNNIRIPDPTGGTDTIYDSTTGKPATLYDLIARPNDTFSFKFSVKASSDAHGVNWCNNNDNPANSWSSPIIGHDNSKNHISTDGSGHQIPGGGLNISGHQENVYHGAKDEYTVSGSAAAIENYCSISASDPQAATANVKELDAFLTANM